MSENFDSGKYWQRRYAKGRDSGEGSYGRLAQFKAAFVNSFVAAHKLTSVIELGCGDGAQLGLARYPQYIGVDISAHAIEMCRSTFGDDHTMFFLEYIDALHLPAQDLALSLDVIFHIIEDSIYEKYIRDLFGMSSKFVIVYSSNSMLPATAPHVRHRNFTGWVNENIDGWQLYSTKTNEYSRSESMELETSLSDFYIYKKIRS